MTAPQKAWQKGIDLSTLQGIEDFYDETHNKFAFSPFTQMNKPSIANAMDAQNLKHDFEHSDHRKQIYYVQKVFKVKSAIYSFDKEVAVKSAGDIEISKIAHGGIETLGLINNLFSGFKNSNSTVWVYIFEEDTLLKQALESFGYTKVTSIYKSTAEILGVYCNKEIADSVPAYDKTTLIEVKVESLNDENLKREYNEALESFTTKLIELGKNMEYANHYSNYNKGKTWRALALRGYSDDVNFIEKPAEVMKSKKWADKYKDKEFTLQNTKLWDYFAEELHALIILCFNKPYSSGVDVKFDRVRLMQLSPGGGELLRHSDLQDPDVGTADGKTMRFHIPIITNPNVDFSAWDWNGDKLTKNFPAGCLFYLDQRKPHTVVNNGDTNRIHLVFDVIASEHTRNLISQND